VGAVIADRDVHRRTLWDDGPGWRALLNNKAILVGCAEHPTSLADSQANGGEFLASRCLPAVLGPQPQQVRHMPVLGMAANVVPDPEGSSDQDHANEREYRTTQNSRIRRMRSGFKGLGRPPPSRSADGDGCRLGAFRPYGKVLPLASAFRPPFADRADGAPAPAASVAP
jgi:hypothetical protein